MRNRRQLEETVFGADELNLDRVGRVWAILKDRDWFALRAVEVVEVEVTSFNRAR